ncbi:thiol reductant ABC exporter subunit CydD [Microbacterium sp. MC2]
MATSGDTPARRRGRPVDPRLLRYGRASRGFFVAIGVISLAQTLTIVAFAWLLTTGVTTVIAGGDLTPTLVAFVAVIALRAGLVWVRELVAARAAARVQGQLRAALIDAVGVLGPGWLATHNSARLAVVAGRGLEALDAYFGRYLPQLVQTAIATPILVAVMWAHDWISGVTVVATIPLIPVFMALIGVATRAVQQRQWSTLGRLASRFADTVRGLSTLKVFGRQHRAVRSIEQVTDQYRRETMRVLRVSFLSGFALEFLASISVAIIAVSIGFRLLGGELPLFVGLFVLLLAPEAYLPLRQVGVQFHAAAEGVAATDDVFAVLDAAAAVTPAPPAEPSTAAIGAGVLVLDDVRVRRGDRTLPPVSFTARPGTITLLEGPSGAGKSSLFAALMGGADFDGTATYGSRDVRALSPATWLAWAGQQPGLVAGTVADNITLGDTTPDPALVARARALALLDDVPAAQSLGVQGAGLSGGQAQRVAVARAFYRHLRGLGPVLALDEPSAALDTETEAALWASLRTFAEGGALVLLVSHRRSARSIADTVVSLSAEVTA